MNAQRADIRTAYRAVVRAAHRAVVRAAHRADVRSAVPFARRTGVRSGRVRSNTLAWGALALVGALLCGTALPPSAQAAQAGVQAAQAAQAPAQAAQAAAQAAQAPAQAAPPASALPASAPVASLYPGGLYVDQGTDAAKATARLVAGGRTADAAAMKQISGQPTAVWLGDWFAEPLLGSVLRRHVAAAAAQNKTMVFATYAIPNRDCGGYSAGGLSETAYLEWNRSIAKNLSGTRAVVIVEPDGLAMLPSAKCAGVRSTRPALIAKAVDILTAAGLTVYLDAGTSGWVDPTVMAGMLRAAGVAQARGFATNVSNYKRVDEERAYANAVSNLVGGKHFVIDVSRNGAGWRGDWCNPSGAALGQNPHVTYGTTKLDALLWVKHPGTSDGPCNGGPAAGKWFEDYALELVRNRR